MNKVLKTGFLFYGLTTCVIGRCKQILTHLLLSADASLDIASLTKTTNLDLWTVTAYWRLMILSWANSRLGVPDRLNCQGWLTLPDILVFVLLCFFFQAEDGIRDPLWSRGLGDVYKRQTESQPVKTGRQPVKQEVNKVLKTGFLFYLSLIHIWRCRRSTLCRSRWSPYH